MKKQETVQLTIEKLSKKGNGLGNVQLQSGVTKECEVPFTFPGDTVRAKLLSGRKGRLSGQLEEIIEPSSDRIVPRCKHFGSCGGCRFQHISYETQLMLKTAFVRNCFHTHLTSTTTVHPIIPSPEPWLYRNKMEYTFSEDKAGNKYLGLILDSSGGKVFNLEECFLTNEWFVTALQGVKSWWEHTTLKAYHPYKDAGSLRTLTLREGHSSGDRLIMVTVSGNPDYALNKKQLDELVAILREKLQSQSQLIIFLRIQQIAKGQQTQFYEMLLYGGDGEIRQDHIRETLQITTSEKSFQVHFRVSPSAFFQPNSLVVERLYSCALSMAGIKPADVVYDLYCGTGTLGICAAQQTKQVIGIELSLDAIVDARANALLNNCENIQFFNGAVETVLANEQALPKPDVVLLDPPRSGLHPKALELLCQLRPKKIVYVSCNPLTQANNVDFLLKQGFRLEALQPVDQFPQTNHVENVAVITA